MEQAVIFEIAELNNLELTENQRAVVTGYLNGQGVLICSSTGISKSFVFEISPLEFCYLYHSDALYVICEKVEGKN